jgi:hypothetical protein
MRIPVEGVCCSVSRAYVEWRTARIINSNKYNILRRRPRHRVRFDGVIEEASVMGRMFTIPAEPVAKGLT